MRCYGEGMAIYHLHTQPLSRAKGANAVAAAAYRSGQKLRDQGTGITHDYRRKSGVQWSGILDASGQAIPGDCREALWNAAEAAERRKDSRIAREIECALPTELWPQQYRRLIRNFVQALQAGEFAGSACDYSIHDKGDGNPHVHMLFTIRETEIAPATRTIKMGNRILFEMREGDRKDMGLPGSTSKLKAIRQKWAEVVNAELAAIGSPERIDHRTLAEQGIQRPAQKHRGRVRTHAKKWREMPPPAPRQNAAAPEISLALAQKPQKEPQPRQHHPQKQGTCNDYIRAVIDSYARRMPRRARSLHQFIEDMQAMGVETILNRARNGRVSGISFQYQGERTKGSDVGWSLAKLQRRGIIIPLHYAEEKAALCRYRNELLGQIQIARERFLAEHPQGLENEWLRSNGDNGPCLG